MEKDSTTNLRSVPDFIDFAYDGLRRSSRQIRFVQRRHRRRDQGDEELYSLLRQLEFGCDRRVTLLGVVTRGRRQMERDVIKRT